MENQMANERLDERTARLKRVIQQAGESVARWGDEKLHDATVTFYSRSSHPSSSSCGHSGTQPKLHT